MKRLVICMDGTWDQVTEPETVTNVVRIAEAVRPCGANRTSQIVYYNSGVGTGDLVDRALGGLFGRGVKGNVKRAYAFLSLNYEPGDEIYLFGFSRGAYSVRALGGLVTSTGILKKEFFDRFEVAWQHYRTPPAERARAQKPHPDTIHAEAGIKCIGVWDTVGSYGIPAGFGFSGLARYVTSWQRGFHDTHVSDRVDVALQALAIDERRRPFSPTFWTSPAGQAPPASITLEQVWFCGVHANVGGGYADSRLANTALVWMIARVTALTPLEFDVDYVRRTIAASPFGTLYRSERFWLVSRLWPFVRPIFATQAQWDRDAWWNGWRNGELPVNERIHWSVLERYGKTAPREAGAQSLYRPPNLPASSIDGKVATRTPEEAALTSPEP
jgi:uncharacterized protein (DUF2235 family)